MIDTKSLIIIVLSLIVIAQTIPFATADSNNCSDMPIYHIIQIKRIVQCMEFKDTINNARIIETNIMVENRLNVIENRLGINHTIPINQTDIEVISK